MSRIGIRWRKSMRPWVIYRFSFEEIDPSTARAGEYTTSSRRNAYRVITALDNEGSASGTPYLDEGESLM